MKVLIYREGEALFEPGDETTDPFVVEEGLVCMESSFNSLYKTEHELPLSEDLMPKLPNRFVPTPFMRGHNHCTVTLLCFDRLGTLQRLSAAAFPSCRSSYIEWQAHHRVCLP